MQIDDTGACECQIVAATENSTTLLCLCENVDAVADCVSGGLSAFDWLPLSAVIGDEYFESGGSSVGIIPVDFDSVSIAIGIELELDPVIAALNRPASFSFAVNYRRGGIIVYRGTGDGVAVIHGVDSDLVDAIPVISGVSMAC